MDVKTIRSKKPAKTLYPPELILKEDVKNLITRNKDLRNEILKRFGIQQSTLYNWLRRNSAEATSITFLFLVWDFLNELNPEEYTDIFSLLTTKEENNE